MAKQKIIVPQQKTFIFGSNEKAEEMDRQINDWAKELARDRKSPAPISPSVSIGHNGEIVIVKMFALEVEI